MAPETLRGPQPVPDLGRIVVVGADGDLGRRVVALLRDDPSVGPVTGLATAPGEHGTGVDLLADDLKPILEGAAVVIHLPSRGGVDLDADTDSPQGDDDVESTQRVLDAAGDVGVEHLVVLSSATVYGAWANNALPLTEDATLRPNPELAFAVQRAELERRVSEWRHAHPSATVTVLRPVPVVGDHDLGWLAESLHAARRVADLDGDPPAQFLHLDDLASAVALAGARRLDGARNVAPDGWLRGAEYTALDAGTPKLRVPRRIGDRLARLRWWLRLAPTPPGVQTYSRHAWVVANDLLRADGWEPTHSNDEAFVDGTPATTLATLSPRRRQELALGIAGGTIALGVGLGTWALVHRARRRA